MSASKDQRHHVPHPLGLRFDPETPRGYHVDLRAKLDTPDWDPPRDPDRTMWVDDVIQPGLAMFEHWIRTRDPAWLDAAERLADHLRATQRHDGPFAGAWVYGYRYPHTFTLEPPWVMSMAQGEAASLLVRVAIARDRDELAASARLALRPLERPVGTDGGVRSTLPNGAVLFEEYPTDPPAHVLNGAIYTLLGAYDVAQGLSDRPARDLFERGAADLGRSLDLWDLGYWTRYDLYPHPIVNVASPFYHDLHITLLTAMERLVDDEAYPRTRLIWERYRANPAFKALAVGRKVAFRLRSPRSTRLQRLWSAAGRT